VDQVLLRPDVEPLVARHGRAFVLRVVRALLDEARARAAAGDAPGLDALLAEVGTVLRQRTEASAASSLRRVLNATGVVVHTNLGRAPLPALATARVAEIASGYSNLEYELTGGERGRREVHAESRLRAMLGAEAAVVVNNCAAAVLLAVNTFAEGREVLVSRGELVEIGGSFRIPEVLRKGGARLREVGTTNRTRIADYRAALSKDTGLILKVHPSNFRVVGFTEAPALEELVALGREAGVTVAEDLGSGLLAPLPPHLAGERTVADALRGGADLVAFSGDKLLGGPQAGLVVGRRAALDPMRRNPLYRALRVDKLTLASLDAVLAEHEAGRAAGSVPILRMLSTPADELRARCERLAAGLREHAPALMVEIVESASTVGGGAAPTLEIPTPVLALTHASLGADRLASALRAGEPPVVARVADGRVRVDLRTVLPGEDDLLRDALVRAAG
jgi:L-seryl-tRNA(Ser) seleniumtransferase